MIEGVAGAAYAAELLALGEGRLLEAVVRALAERPALEAALASAHPRAAPARPAGGEDGAGERVSFPLYQPARGGGRRWLRRCDASTTST